MRFVFLSVVLLASFAGTVFTGSVQAQQGEDRTLRGFLSDLLSGDEGKALAVPKTGAAERRVPFGQSDIQLSFAPLVKETSPAVVNVYASSTVQVRSPFMGDPFFEQFFGRPQMPPRVRSSLGSGVLVDPSGVIVTNNHVISDADEVKVALADGREFESEILLKDKALDLAVLKISGDETFPAVGLGNSDNLEVGDLVLAIGNPFGVGQTTTSGIVSALARSHVGVSDFGFFIQTDAAINPGNSGGALIDMRGQVIGINTAIVSRSGGSIGIGFAIPANMVRAVVNAALSGAKTFERPFFGVSFDPVTAQIAEALGMERPVGALVREVAPDSPAERAGLRPGDVVVAMDGADIQHPDALEYRLVTHPLDDEGIIGVLRDGKTLELSFALERLSDGANPSPVTLEGRGPFAGAAIATLEPRLAQRLKLPLNKKGVVVLEVDRRALAASVGLRPGDIIREVNGIEIEDVETMQVLAGDTSSRWDFAIERDGRILRQRLRF
ncbi:DegQ family serine endoprotease [Nitratireductor kimnyeongensis]|uniref:DegQ family serine endoprotease n=1 Tax=Nitratireductor kimnyeongensis TaxID=430679 RepID=A0ABW0T9C6_9HYPH|nr:DegQ family serine endoprotease [Nitratireductor kimnyeongensis]QZZ35573.1 DegQ family serine endoprotease [Nitratireductor kimnyeongensis]